MSPSSRGGEGGPPTAPPSAAAGPDRDDRDDSDDFLSTYLSLQRPSWSSDYVDLELLTASLRRMEGRLAAMRRERRGRMLHHHRRGDAPSPARQGAAAAADGRPTAASSSGASPRSGGSIVGYHRHRNVRSEGYLPALALAPEPPPPAAPGSSDGGGRGADGGAGAASTPKVDGEGGGGGRYGDGDGEDGEHRSIQGRNFEPLSPQKKSLSMDWLHNIHLPTMQNVASVISLGGLGGGGGHSNNGEIGRPRSDSAASAYSSGGSSSAHHRGGSDGWVQPGSDQDDFCRLLDGQVEKAALFYLSELGRVAGALREMAALGGGGGGGGGAAMAARGRTGAAAAAAAVGAGDRASMTPGPTGPATTAASPQDRPDPAGDPADSSALILLDWYCALGATLADLHVFVAANLTAVRKILVRHDRLVQPYGKPLADWYVRTRRRGETSHLESLWGHRGLGAVCGSWRERFQGSLRNAMMVGRREADEEAAGRLLVCIEAVAVRMRDAEHRSVQDLVVFGSVGNTLALEPTVLAKPVDDNDWDLAYYALQRNCLGGLVDLGDVEGGAAVGGGDFIGAEVGPLDGKVEATGIDYYLPLGLNLFSTFLYMTNYFIAGPTSAVYIQTLGGNKALAGLVIGATPWAAMVSAVIFSVWTNCNFRAPLLFSGACLCVGNLLYGCALRFDSIGLVLLGRLCVGLGGPRVINRRYIADITPMESRTAVSAAFVTLSAAGTAVGPGLSALLQNVDFTFNLPLIGRVMMNGLTAPGYLMFLIWLLFAIVLALTFNEPERHGLKELQNKTVSPIVSRQPSINGDSEEKDQNVPTKTVTHQSSPIHNVDEGLLSEESTEYGQYQCTSEGQTSDPDASYAVTSEETNLLLHANDENKVPEYSAVPQTLPARHSFEMNKGEKILPEKEEEHTLTTGASFMSEASWFPSCLRNFSLQVWICIILLFVDKLTMEAVMSSVPVIAGHTYFWSVTQIGALGFTMGVLVVPLSICVGWVSRYHEDRTILRWLLYVSLVGIIFLVDMPGLFGESPDHNNRYSFFCVGPHKYIYGCLIAFSGLQCLESIIMSMLSKVVPHSLAKGVCNSGLINTETGTFGRAIGDVVVTFAGLASLDRMLNVLMLPLACIIIGCLLMVRYWYQALAV